jgi:hypothetical protein
MHPCLKKFQTVYVIRDYKTIEIDIDDIVQTARNKFKSIKFRHTLYKTGDFFLTKAEALAYCLQLHQGGNLG